MLKDALPRESWPFREALPWSYQEGIRLIESPLTMQEEIERCFNQNDSASATNNTRVLIEMALKEKCENLGVRLEFLQGRRNDQRSAVELIDGLRGYLRKNQSLGEKQKKRVFDDVRAASLLTNIGSHHRQPAATALSRGDVKSVLSDLDEFSSLFTCAKCRTQASRKYSTPHEDLKQCRCGELRI